MKAKTLKPRLSLINTQRLRSAPAIDATLRQRGEAWQVRRIAQLQSEPLCKHCADLGLVTLANQVDHVRPLWSGPGLDIDDNLQSLCVTCHAIKTAREASDRAKARRD